VRREDVQADLTWEQMAQADKALEQAAAGAEMALLFYTGHGVQIDGVPYLVPVELPRPTPETLKSEGGKEILKHGLVELDKLLDGLDEHAGLAVAIFDACREIPQFRQASKAVFGDDAPYRGLARPKNSGRHRILAYSASSGELALDGKGRHSPYVQTWLDEFDRKAGQEDLIAFFNGVAAQVTDSRGQNPEVVSSGVMPGSYYFQTPAAAPKPELPDLAAVEQGVWDIIQDSDKPADFAKYLRQCQQGRFPCPNAEEARRRLDALKEAQGRQEQPNKAQPSAAPPIQAPLPPTNEPDNILNAAPAVPARAKPATGKADFGIEMVSLPGGTFQMGCGPKDGECYDNEKPRHAVTVRPFALGKTEVTQGQWRAVMGAPPPELSFKNCGDDCPVESVSFDEVQAFIKKLKALTGKSYRLPTEAEWEYACRAGENFRYCGSDDPDAVAWYSYKQAGETPHPVAGKQANAWSLHDMSGNVWEWTADCWHDGYKNAPVDGTAWQEAEGGDCGRRVVRGSSWYFGSSLLRPAYRTRFDPAFRTSNLGVRLAQDL